MTNRSFQGWLFFTLLLALNISSHSMWADELQAWSLTRASSDIFDLFIRLDREGHPILWYLLLWCPSHLTANPEAMKLITFILGAGSIYLIWFKAPFSWREKTLLCLSYQIGFNLTVLSRCYGLGLFLVLLFASLKPKTGASGWQRWLVLALLANVHLYFAVGTLVLATVWLTQEDTDTSGLPWVSIYLLGMFLSLFTLGRFLDDLIYPVGHFLTVLVGVIVLAIFLHRLRQGINFLPLKLSLIGIGIVALCTVAMLATPHSKSGAGSLSRIARSLSTLGGGLTPIVRPQMTNYWDVQFPTWLGLVLFLTSTIVVFYIFREEPISQTLLASTSAFFLLIFCVRQTGTSWHVGVLFSIIISLVWQKRNQRKSASKLFYVLLALQAIYGVQAMIGSKFVSLSNSKACATWVRAHENEVDGVFGMKVFPTLAVATYLQDPLYFPEADGKRSHTTWRDWARDEKIPILVLRQMRREQLNTIYLIAPSSNRESLESQFNDHRESLSWETASLVSGAILENYVIFLIRREKVEKSKRPQPSGLSTSPLPAE